ncbi:phosphate-starvation-inducible PsiE family protein [Thermosynechococcaceae cyanobacterium BACA0444]|uniref:Phosphate-starvation-inducible PsiE family protein n=1 Tax=Pseudocalidococcus azoricus BACA0444 TaxID=2918990 RepID=A0AAE4FST7_9CYAN|nr:phosphate-starvation-inducible PsiE family protein [Pseudocalidococcus azoricus]MDS3861143.1 phosphate-starvation-inducible PsiE family protein [Pseudocalidococcus azoricus BACA0444]
MAPRIAANSNIAPQITWFSRQGLVAILETIQDLIVISLCIGLFSFMVLELREMFISLLPPLDFPNVTADILFLLILVELFRLLIIYLQEQRVSIGVAVEVAIVSVLREVIVRGVLEVPWSHVLSACAFLLVMGALLVIRVWLPPTFAGVDPEREIRRRYQLSSILPNNLTREDPPPQDLLTSHNDARANQADNKT